MPRTISDAEVAQIEQERNLLKFIRSVWDDPELNPEAKALVKRKYPNIQIPDLDIRNEVRGMIESDRAERQRIEDEKRQQEEDRKFDEARSSAQKKYGLTEDGMKDLEDFMVKNNVGSYDVAAGYRVAQNPKPSEATFDDQRWNHSKKEGFAEIAKDPEAWGRGEIMRAIARDTEREKQQRF